MGRKDMMITETIERPTRTEPKLLTPAQLKRLERIRSDAASVAGFFERAYRGEASPRECIKAQCLDCCGLDKIAIAECGDRCCPLWLLRPYQDLDTRPNLTPAGVLPVTPST
jgi:hypothetical protein